MTPNRRGQMASHIGRRKFLATLGGAAAAWPLAARAQQGERVRRIGVLLNLAADDPETGARRAAFLQGLQELGWSEGRNLRIDYRWGVGDSDRHRANAAELVALAPDVLLANGSPIVRQLQRATRTVPIVWRKMARVAQADWAAGNASGGDSRSHQPFRHRPMGRHPSRGAVVRGGGNADRRERRWRDRARYHCICPPAEWRPGRDGDGVEWDSSRRDHCPCGAISFARRLPLQLLRRCRRPDLLRP